ncbi:FmdB family zinc ribbon protein [Salidesulfovibrio brasiliensis]|uniref:FmdB family zinc ribbon protein n=1 Tax=Salidesulfovibrio brasiliensis TaxID=221711 RepID=UPI0006CF88A9|nr:zinc ribbon domain-containing protein [Salidesulfovibrio brasiliensis]
MPIYEYRCLGCGHEYEELVAATAPAPDCPKCGGEGERLISATTIGGNDSVPDVHGHGCCGDRPGSRGCVPGSCCGKA